MSFGQSSDPWFIKYLPSSSSQIIGRDSELAALKSFISNYSKQQKKGMLLYGPCGSGKTSTVVALAKEFNYEVFELNASDARNKDQLREKLGPALTQQSFFYSGKIILVDEIDGVSGMKDRGGATELAKLVGESKFPIILTANDASTKKIKPVLKVCSQLFFDKLSTKTIREILLRVVEAEGVRADEKIIHTLAAHSDGDVRAAINDLELLAGEDLTITPEKLTILSERKRTQLIEDGLTTVFKTTDADIARQAFSEVESDIDQTFLWVDYNTGLEYTKPKDLARAYGAISKADVFRRRITRNQEWRFIVYINDLLTAGVACAKEAPYRSAPQYKQSARLLKIWQMNMANAKRKVIAEKIAEATHCSSRVAFQQIGYYQQMFKAGGDMADAVADELELDKDEVAWLRK